MKNAPAARASSVPVVPDALIERAAARFALLSDPTRLRLVSALHLQGEGSVGALAEAAGISVANASQHLNRLAAGGIVGRRRDGTSVHYRIVDDSIEPLCHLVCDALAEDPPLTPHAATVETRERGSAHATIRRPVGRGEPPPKGAA